MAVSLTYILLMLTITTIEILITRTEIIDESILNGWVKVKIDNSGVQLHFKKGDGYKTARIGRDIPLQGEPNCKSSDHMFKAVWTNGIELTLVGNLTSVQNGDINRLQILWRDNNGAADYLQDCWDMAPYNWYGGGEIEANQPWPIQTMAFPFSPYISGNGFGSGEVVAPFFLSSESVYYFVQPTNPLFVSIQGLGENKTLCWRSEFKTPYRNSNGRNLTLDYIRVSVEPANMTAAWLDFISYIGKTSAAPSLKVIRDPIWSTWAVFKSEVNQSTVIDWARQIHDRGFPVSQIEIDDRWEWCYGQEEFDPIKFPDPASMVSELNSLGYDVTLWVHPFVNVECPLFAEGDASKYFVTVDGFTTTGISSWWDGSETACIDVSNTEARTWWYNRLQTLKKIGFASFKFDAGESSYLPNNSYLHVAEELQPGFYTTAYTNFTKSLGDQVEARVAYMSQDQGGMFSRLGDRSSVWGLNNGLHSVITATLQYGIIGYPYVLPDYIGGDAYSSWPDRELYIRWAQVNAFLPVMQFSIYPWGYDDQVVAIVTRMIELHHNISDVLEQCVVQALQDGSPIIRPLWWISPNDVTTQTVNDQFLVGSTYLVAPIVSQGATQRNIYVPSGMWTDMLRGSEVTGPTWLNNYSVSLDEIAYFKNTAV